MAEFLATNFWLLCGVLTGGVGAFYLRWRLLRVAVAGEIENAEVARFSKAWFIAIMIPCAILWTLQLSAGPAASPRYIVWPSPQKWIALGVNMTCWILLLWWVWLSGGAQVLSKVLTLSRPRYHPALLYSPFAIKAFTLFGVAMGVVAIAGEMGVHAF